MTTTTTHETLTFRLDAMAESAAQAFQAAESGDPTAAYLAAWQSVSTLRATAGDKETRRLLKAHGLSAAKVTRAMTGADVLDSGALDGVTDPAVDSPLSGRVAAYGGETGTATLAALIVGNGAYSETGGRRNVLALLESDSPAHAIAAALDAIETAMAAKRVDAETGEETGEEETGETPTVSDVERFERAAAAILGTVNGLIEMAPEDLDAVSGEAWKALGTAAIALKRFADSNGERIAAAIK